MEEINQHIRVLYEVICQNNWGTCFQERPVFLIMEIISILFQSIYIFLKNTWYYWCALAVWIGFFATLKDAIRIAVLKALQEENE